jgi:hypothetical protein
VRSSWSKLSSVMRPRQSKHGADAKTLAKNVVGARMWHLSLRLTVGEYADLAMYGSRFSRFSCFW